MRVATRDDLDVDAAANGPQLVPEFGLLIARVRAELERKWIQEHAAVTVLQIGGVAAEDCLLGARIEPLEDIAPAPGAISA